MMGLDYQKKTLEDRGLVKLEGFIPKAQITLARDLICSIAEKYGLYSASSWRRSASRFSNAKPFRAAINELNHADQFPNLISKEVVQIASDLQGEGVVPLPPDNRYFSVCRAPCHGRFQMMFGISTFRDWVIWVPPDCRFLSFSTMLTQWAAARSCFLDLTAY